MNDTNILKKETKNLTKANFEEVIKEYLKDYFYNKETKIDIHICTKDDYLQSSSSGTRLYYDDKIEDKLPMLLDNFEEGLYNCIIADDFVEDDDGDDEYGRPIILEFCFRSITFEKIYDADTLIKKANNYINKVEAERWDILSFIRDKQKGKKIVIKNNEIYVDEKRCYKDISKKALEIIKDINDISSTRYIVKRFELKETTKKAYELYLKTADEEIDELTSFDEFLDIIYDFIEYDFEYEEYGFDKKEIEEIYSIYRWFIDYKGEKITFKEAFLKQYVSIYPKKDFENYTINHLTGDYNFIIKENLDTEEKTFYSQQKYSGYDFSLVFDYEVDKAKRDKI